MNEVRILHTKSWKILLICSLNHYRHHLLRGVFVESVWWDLERWQTQGEILHTPVCESRSRWSSTQHDDWVNCTLFPLCEFSRCFSYWDFWWDNSCNMRRRILCALSPYFSHWVFRSFLDIDNTGWRTKGSVGKPTHAYRAAPSFLGWGVFL